MKKFFSIFAVLALVLSPFAVADQETEIKPNGASQAAIVKTLYNIQTAIRALSLSGAVQPYGMVLGPVTLTEGTDTLTLEKDVAFNVAVGGKVITAAAADNWCDLTGLTNNSASQVNKVLIGIGADGNCDLTEGTRASTHAAVDWPTPPADSVVIAGLISYASKNWDADAALTRAVLKTVPEMSVAGANWEAAQILLDYPGSGTSSDPVVRNED